MTPFEFAGRTRIDIDEAIDFYDAVDPQLAQDLRAAVKEAIRDVLSNPHGSGYYPGTRHRMTRLRRFPYYVLYLFRKGIVSFRAMPHEKQDSAYWRKRRRT